jgi:erythromycin esterase-like protein
VARNLRDLLSLRLKDGNDLFDIQQNARVVANAEDYYRTMILGDEDSWNVRDRHMLETLDILLRKHGPGSKAIVWAHNTHIGDHRATDMQAMGQVNIGGLARMKWGAENTALVGFGTYKGEVIAGPAWGGPAERMRVPEGRGGSWEAALHAAAVATGAGAFTLDLQNQDEIFAKVIGHRAIGVVYRPEYERFGNYVPSMPSRRYDAFLFIDESRALEPLRVYVDSKEIPETWPQGL